MTKPIAYSLTLACWLCSEGSPGALEEAAGWHSKCVICYLTSLWPGFKFAMAQNTTSVLSEGY